MRVNRSKCGGPRPLIALVLLVTLAMLGASQSALATSFTVKNNCGYTVYPGIYPATYQNGGWSMASGASVSFTVPSGWIGRIWGRTGCNSASPAVCSTGQCGGTGLQCAGTTGQAGTSLAEFNINASGTDWYDVSYVDGMDNPVGIQVSNGSCVSPNTCTSNPITSCDASLKTGSYCLSPCTKFNTDQYCCRGAYGTQATCVVANWPASARSYVNNIHTYCPNQYSYAYDDNVGLHTCATGANYTITFCPNGGGGGGTSFNGSHTLTPRNATGLRLDDSAASTAAGNKIQVYTSNGTAAQTWVFSNNGVSPSGYYNLAVSLGPYCMSASGTTSGSLVNLQPCNGSTGQAWNVVSSSGYYQLKPANNTGLCLYNPSTTSGTQVQVRTCSTATSYLWSIN